MHSPRDLPNEFRQRRLAESGGLARVPAGALRDCALVPVPCALSGVVVTFRGPRALVVQSWLFVDVQISCRRSTLDMVVVFGVLTVVTFGHVACFQKLDQPRAEPAFWRLA